MEKEIKELLNKIKKTELDDFLDSPHSIELIIEILRRWDSLSGACDLIYSAFEDGFHDIIRDDIENGFFDKDVKLRYEFLNTKKETEIKEINKLINDAEYIYDQLLCDGIPLCCDIERAFLESVGRLTVSEDSAIKFIKEFIEDHKEDIK